MTPPATGGRFGLILLIAMSLSGCATLPAFGPSSDAIVEAADTEIAGSTTALPFRLVNVSALNLPVDRNVAVHFPRGFLGRGFLRVEESIGASDLLELRIWETADNGLFASNGQRETVFSVGVSNTGTIDVPYAGQISVAGQTPSQVRQILLDRYRGMAIDPEISVSIAKTSSRAITVLGAVRSSGRSEVPSNGIRLLDLLAQAGGAPHPAWEVDVTVSRGALSGQVGLDQIYAHRANNIVMLPGDTVQVTHAPRRYAVYGAISRSGNTELNVARPSLSTLLAEVGGLNDMQAEPNSVFVFRRADNSRGNRAGMPTAYRLDFSRPDAFLLADRFVLRDTDIIYVATADASEFKKFVTTLLSPLLGSANGIQSIGN